MRQVKLKDITTKIGSGATPSGGKQSYKTTGIALIRSLNVFDLNFSYDELAYINDEQAKKLNNVTIEPDDILLNITGASVARCCILPKNLLPARVNQHVSIIRINKGLANPYFIQYLLVSPYYKQKLLSIAQGGATREALTKESIENFEIIIPKSKNTQDKIAKILSNYDDLIENNNKRIKILEEMAQKIYKEWFVDFRFPGHETTTFKQSELGKIPSDWKIDLANQIAEIYIGRTPSRKDFECFTTCKKDKKWVSIKDIGHSNEYIFDTSEYLTENAIKKYNVPLIPKDTIILSFKLTVGKVTITTEEMTSNEAIAQFQIKDKELIPTNYLFLYLKNFEYNNLGNTSSIGNAINSTIVKNMPIIVPNKGVVQKFDKIIINIFNQIKNLSQQNTNLKQVRDLLLPRLISGEIDVENLNIL